MSLSSQRPTAQKDFLLYIRSSIISSSSSSSYILLVLSLSSSSSFSSQVESLCSFFSVWLIFTLSSEGKKHFLSEKKEKNEKLLKKMFFYPKYAVDITSRGFRRKTKNTKPLARAKKCCVPRWQVAFSTLTCEGSPGSNSLAVL